MICGSSKLGPGAGHSQGRNKCREIYSFIYWHLHWYLFSGGFGARLGGGGVFGVGWVEVLVFHIYWYETFWMQTISIDA